MAMDPDVFGQRLRQERRHRKYCNLLEMKRGKNPYAEPDAEDGRSSLDEEESDEEEEDNKKKRENEHSSKPQRKKQRK